MSAANSLSCSSWSVMRSQPSRDFLLRHRRRVRAADRAPEELAEQHPLAPEVTVDGLRRDPRLDGDGGYAGPHVPALLEESLGCVEHEEPRLLRLLLSAGSNDRGGAWFTFPPDFFGHS